MECKNCSAPLDDDAGYCSYCGARVLKEDKITLKFIFSEILDKVLSVDNKLIDEIEQRYRSLLREKRSEKLSREEMRQLFVESHEKMREEIRAVLTPEQQEIAEQQVKKQKEKRMARHLKRLAKDLDLTKEQRSQLKVALKESKERWPMDKQQRDAERQQFQKTLESILTEEQLAKWEEIRQQSKEKWRNHGEDRLRKPLD